MFDFALLNNANTLGFMNRAFVGTAGSGNPWSTTDAPAAAPPNYVGDPNPNLWLGAAGTYVNRTYPNLNWANRPFVSHYELLQVPAAGPTRLIWEFGFSASGGNSYSVSSGIFLTPFKTLLNFMMTAAQTTPSTAPHFYRLLDYVRVPSRFVGTDTILNPYYSSALPNPYATAPQNPSPAFIPNDHTNEKAMFSYLHPPFNKISKHRDPGKININTIPYMPNDPNPIVWNATVNGASLPGTADQNITANGPGWAQVATSMGVPGMPYVPSLPTTPVTVASQPNSPSIFANPFRSAAGADYSLPNVINPYTSSVITSNKPLFGINATLMRPDPYTQASMLFDFPPPPQLGPTSPTANSAENQALTYIAQAFNAPDRNSYFRYQNLQRMGNLVTTRSNVYACWVTVGYFQVLPWTGSSLNYPQNLAIDNVHPDGYQLADELGSDTGEVVRHRAFYIIDRTIPVGYERGMNHNVDRAILLRRYIE